MVLLDVPPVVIVAVTCTVAVAAGSRMPRLHVTRRPATEQVPWLAVTVPALEDPGSDCVNVTFVAGEEPAFVTVAV
jgi:hypothetical protein